MNIGMEPEIGDRQHRPLQPPVDHPARHRRSIPQGAPGATGASGPRGPAGKIELVTCKPVTTGKRKHKKTVQKCSSKLTSAPVKFTTAGSLITAHARRP